MLCCDANFPIKIEWLHLWISSHWPSGFGVWSWSGDSHLGQQITDSLGGFGWNSETSPWKCHETFPFIYKRFISWILVVFAWEACWQAAGPFGMHDSVSFTSLAPRLFTCILQIQRHVSSCSDEDICQWINFFTSTILMIGTHWQHRK